MSEEFKLDDLCMRCMNALPAGTGICPLCGFDRDAYEPKAHHRSPGEISHGRYLIGAVIGEGGFGITYSGRDLAAKRRAAIKELFIVGAVTRMEEHVVLADDTIERRRYFLECRDKLLQEGEALQAMQDKSGVVNVFDYYLENGTAYLVMEYLDGDDLLAFLNKNGGAISYREAFNMLRPVMKSMIEVHSAGIIHRDISPDNIRCLPNGQMKLMDFGSAKFTTRNSNSMLVLVKAGYAPPEQYVQNFKIGPWIDVYAMSATIYRCITGTAPKASPDRKADDDIQRPSSMGVDIPMGAEDVLMRAMSLKAEDRYQNMYEFYVALKDADRSVADPQTGTGSKAQALPLSGSTKLPGDDGYEELLAQLNSSGSNITQMRVFILVGAMMEAVIIAILLSRFFH